MADSVATVVKSSFNPGKIVGGIVGFIIIAAIFDAAGFTQWLLYPVTSIKAKFFSKPSA